MASSSTRAAIVLRALKLAGRGVELKADANEWLNEMLRDWALDFRYPSLRKTGAPVTLPVGSTSVSLPSDFGAGMEKQGMLFGVENQPLDEKSFEEFAFNRGVPSQGTGNGRPIYYYVDKQAGKFVFNSPADQAYPFTPVYFSVPADIDTTAAGDNQKVWVDNDALVTQGLIASIYQYTSDDREMAQFQKVYEPREGLQSKWKRQVATMGGTSRIMLSPARFKKINF